MKQRLKNIWIFFWRHIIEAEIIFTILIIFLWTWGFHVVEWVGVYDSFYYTIITIAWVGYGDITPVTWQGKFIAVSLASLGTPLYLITASIIASKLLEAMKKMKKWTNKTIISKVKALLVADGHILFIKKHREDISMRDLPWWAIQYGERAETALMRKVTQQIHVQVILERSLGIWWWVDKQTGIFSLCHTYLAQVHPADIGVLQEKQLTDWGEQLCWLSVYDICSWACDLENESLTELIKKHFSTAIYSQF